MLFRSELAVSIHDEAQRMLSWPRMRWKLVDWQRDTAPYFRALKYSSCLVRAAAAHALGQLYYGCATQGRKITPPLAELLRQMSALERDTPGIAGPFLCGFHFNNSPLTELWSGIDMGTWMLATLRESRQEPEMPHCLSLAFYAHELFDKDANAIEAMLKMGRRGLAVYTATQSPEHVEAIRPTLERMASSDDAEIAQAIQTYLAKPSHHNGTQFLTGPAFGLTNYS